MNDEEILIEARVLLNLATVNAKKSTYYCKGTTEAIMKAISLARADERLKVLKNVIEDLKDLKAINKNQKTNKQGQEAFDLVVTSIITYFQNKVRGKNE